MPRLYEDLAPLWPLMSPPADYLPEATAVRDVLHETLGRVAHGQPHALLELGAGGGHTLFHLADEYACTAADLSDAMLANCRALNPSVETIVGDMRTLRLDRAFDAVLIHDAIDYLTTLDDVRATFATAAAHLPPGGVLIVAPTYTAETFTDHQHASDCNADEDLELRYVSYVCRAEPGDTTFEMRMALLIRELQRDQPHGRLRIEYDTHTCGLFPQRTWIELMRDAGFEVQVRDLLADDDASEASVPMFVGVRGEGD